MLAIIDILNKNKRETNVEQTYKLVYNLYDAVEIDDIILGGKNR